MCVMANTVSSVHTSFEHTSFRRRQHPICLVLHFLSQIQLLAVTFQLMRTTLSTWTAQDRQVNLLSSSAVKSPDRHGRVQSEHIANNHQNTTMGRCYTEVVSVNVDICM